MRRKYFFAKLFDFDLTLTLNIELWSQKESLKLDPNTELIGSSQDNQDNQHTEVHNSKPTSSLHTQSGYSLSQQRE
jgi:hypothetical protein